MWCSLPIGRGHQLLQRKRKVRADRGSKRPTYKRKKPATKAKHKVVKEADSVGLGKPSDGATLSTIVDYMSPLRKHRKSED